MAVYKKTSFSTPDAANDITNQMPSKTNLPSELQVSMSTVDSLASSTAPGKWYICKCKSVVGTDDNRAKGQFYPVYFAADVHGTVIGSTVAAPCPPFCNDDTGSILVERIIKLESQVKEILDKIDKTQG